MRPSSAAPPPCTKGLTLTPSANGCGKASQRRSMRCSPYPRSCRRAAVCSAIADPEVDMSSAGTVAVSTASATDQGQLVRQEEVDRYLGSYASQPIERGFVVDSDMIEGTIPADLNGTLLRNGPGNFDFGDAKINMVFDGDGLVTAYAFKEGHVTVRRRFVRTQALRDEMAAGQLLYKGAFTVGDPSGRWQLPTDLTVRQPANTGVVDWGGRILALFEADLPYELDATLATLGKTRLGIWDDEDFMAAHHRIRQEDDGSLRLVAFSAQIDGLDNKVKVVELAEDGAKVCEHAFTIANGAFGFFHDMLVTDNYYIFLENPMRLDVVKLVTKYVPGEACIAECLVFDPAKPARIHCIPRPGKSGYARPVYEAYPMFTFHHINAYEVNSATIVIDTFARSGIDFGKLSFEAFDVKDLHGDEKKTRPLRIVVRGTAREARVLRLGELVPGLSRDVEFPTPLPPAQCGRPYGCYFAVADRELPGEHRGVPQCVMKVEMSPSNGANGRDFDPGAVSTTFYYAGDGRYVQEPIFVARADARSPDDGYLLVHVSDLNGEWRTCLEILETRNLAQGPLARIWLPDHMPAGLHGSWTNRYLGPQPGEALPFTNDIRERL